MTIKIGGWYRIAIVISVLWFMIVLWLGISNLFSEYKHKKRMQLDSQAIFQKGKLGLIDDLGIIQKDLAFYERKIQEAKNYGYGTGDIMRYLLYDNTFSSLNVEDRRDILTQLDTDFANLPKEEQDKVLLGMPFSESASVKRNIRFLCIMLFAPIVCLWGFIWCTRWIKEGFKK